MCDCVPLVPGAGALFFLYSRTFIPSASTPADPTEAVNLVDPTRRPEVQGARDELLELVRVAKNQPRGGLSQALEVLFGTLSELPSADEVEFALIERALKLADGNVNEAARVLGLSRATIYRRLRKDKPDSEAS